MCTMRPRATRNGGVLYKVFRTGLLQPRLHPTPFPCISSPFPQHWCLSGELPKSMVTVGLDVYAVTRNSPRTATKSLSLTELTMLLSAPGSSGCSPCLECSFPSRSLRSLLPILQSTASASPCLEGIPCLPPPLPYLGQIPLLHSCRTLFIS